MDLIEFLVVRLILSILPVIVLKSLDTYIELDLWRIYIPIMWSILVSVFLPRKIKWVFRYLTPYIILVLPQNNEHIDTLELVKESSKYKEMFYDCLTFIDVISLMHVFKDEIISITSVIIYRLYERIQKYGQSRVILYIIVCMVHAFILVFCLDYFVWIAQYWMYYFFYLKTSTVSVQLSTDFRNMDYSLPELQLYEKHHSYKVLSKGMLIYEGSYAKIDNIRTPLCREVYYRVPGEYVKISCNAKIWTTQLLDFRNTSFTGKYRSYYWEQNLKRIKDFDNDSYRKDETFHLTIKSIKSEDFSTEISFWGERDVIYKNKVLTIKIKIGYFFLQLQKDIEHYIHVPNGYILNIYNLKFYAQSTYDDVVISNNISSIVSENVSGDTSALCDKEFDGCRPMVKYLYEEYYNKWFDKRKLNSIKLSSSNNDFFANSLACVCTFVYGKHKFFAQQLTFVKNLNRSVLTEIELPYSFVVLPTGLTHYSRQKYDKLRKDVIGRISKSEDWRYSFKFFKDDENAFNHYMHAVENVVTILFVIDLCIIMVLIVKFYNYIFIRRVSRYILIQSPQHTLPEACPCNIGNLSVNEAIKYDIMITYNEDEYSLVKNSFVPFFENHNLSVFVADRDMIPGRTKARAYSEAVQSCRNFVIIGSDKFVNDQWNNDFILGDLILQMIHEHQGHHVIVVKWNNAEVPRAFRWDPKITIIEWSERRSTSENMTIFKNRVQSIPCIGRMFC